MRCHERLAQTEPSVATGNLVVRENLKSATYELLCEIAEDENIVECSAAQAYAVEAGTVAKNVRDSREGIDESTMEACADHGSGNQRTHIAKERMKQRVCADEQFSIALNEFKGISGLAC